MGDLPRQERRRLEAEPFSRRRVLAGYSCAFAVSSWVLCGLAALGGEEMAPIALGLGMLMLTGSGLLGLIGVLWCAVSPPGRSRTVDALLSLTAMAMPALLFVVALVSAGTCM